MSETLERKGEWLKCPKCGHEWLSKSEMDYVTCPNGMHKVNRRKARNNYLTHRKK